MKKIALTLLTIFSLFVISCEIGLGASVDTDAPSLEILNPPVDSVIRDTFALSGTWADDGNIASVNVALKRTDISGETKNIAGTLAGDIRLGGSGTWTAEIVPVAEDGTKLISDGSYQATVTIKDTVGRTTIRNTTFTIDNTPPVIVLTRPSTAADSLSSDTYGQTFNLEGQAADTNNVSLIEVMIYSDAECTNHIHTVPLKNVPNSINMDVAKFVKGDTENDYFKIYGESTTEGGPKQFYCKVVAYDGAQRFPADGSAQTEADQKGNGIDTYYLYKDIATTILQNYKITEVYSMLNGTYTASGTARSVSVEDVMTLLNKSKKAQGKFTLNPKNNPTFQVTGKNPLLLDGHDFEGGKNDVTANGQVVIEVSPGLDGILLDEDSLAVYAIECNASGVALPGAEKIYPTTTKQESGTSYKFITTISRDKGFVIGRNYIFGVDGHDQAESPNSIEPVGLAYGFHMSSSGKAPNLTITNPTTSNAYLNEEKANAFVFEGNVALELGVPTIRVYKDKVSDTDEPIDTITFSQVASSTTGGELNYPFTWHYSNFTDKTTVKFTFEAVYDGITSQPIEKTIVYDFVEPTITILKVTPNLEDVKKYDSSTEDGTTIDGSYLNGTPEFTLAIVDEYDQIASASYQIEIDGTKQPVQTITNPARQVISIDTTPYNNSTLKLEIVAEDRAGNKHTEINTYTIDQETDKPVILPGEPSTITFKLPDQAAYNAQGETKKGIATVGTSLLINLHDDDGLHSLIIKNSNNNITSWDGNTWVDLTRPKDNQTIDSTTSNVEHILSGTDKTFSYPLPSDGGGLYKFYYKLTDKYGTSIEDTFVLNLTKAAAEISSVKAKDGKDAANANGTITTVISIIESQQNYKLVWSKNGGAENTVEANLASTAFPYEHTINASDLTVGSNTISYKILDGNGRPSAWQDITLIRDDNLPTVKLNSLPGITDITTFTSYTFQGTVSDTGLSGADKVILSISGTTASGGTKQFEIIPNGENWVQVVNWDEIFKQSDGTHLYGEKTVTVTAYDKAGNASSDFALGTETGKTSVSFIYDKEKPTLTINTPYTNVTNNKYIQSNAKISGTASDNFALAESNALIVTELLEGEETDASGQPVTIGTDNKWSVNIPLNSSTANGNYTYRFTLKDKAGNERVLNDIKLILDTLAPTVSLKALPGRTDTKNKGFTFTGSADDATSGVKEINFTIKDLTDTSKTHTVTFDTTSSWSYTLECEADEWKNVFTSEGKKTIYISATDDAGLTSEYFTYEKDTTEIQHKETTNLLDFIYDTADPKLENITGFQEFMPSAGLTISGKASDTNKLASLKIIEKINDVETDESKSVDPAKNTIVVSGTLTNWTKHLPLGEIPSANEEYEYTYSFVLKDEVGNTVYSSEYTTTLDKLSPDISITKPVSDTGDNAKKGKKAIDETSFKFEGKVENETNLSAVYYVIDSSPTAPAKPTANVINASSWTALNFEQANIGTTLDGTTNWNFYQSFKAKTSSETDKLPESLNYYLHVYAVDKAGNVSTVANRNFDVDLSDPVSTATVSKKVFNKSDLTSNKGSFTLNGETSDTLGLASAVITAENKKDSTKSKTITKTDNGEWEQKFIFGSAEDSSANNYLAEGQYEITVKATDTAGKEKTSDKITITVDYTPPELQENTIKLNDEEYSADNWNEARSLKLDIGLKDTVSEITTVKCMTYKTGTLIKTVPLSDNGTTDGIVQYTGTAQFNSDGSDLSFKIYAKDAAGNEFETETAKTVKIDTSAPVLTVYNKYKIGTAAEEGSFKSLSGTVFINDEATLTVYGNYKDEQSGVKELQFGGTVNGTDGKPKQPTVTYSTAAASDTNTNYVAYASISNKNEIKSWKAVFANNILGTATLTVTGWNNAGTEGLSVDTNLFAISKDTTKPTFKNLSFTTDSEHFSVYPKKAKRTEIVNGVSKEVEYVEKYYIHNSSDSFSISGLAEDAIGSEGPASGVEKVVLTISGVKGSNVDTDTSSITSEAGAYFTGLDFSECSGTSVTPTLKVYDKAGNSKEYTLPEIIFDTTGPASLHEVDSTGKDLVFRIAETDNNDIADGAPSLENPKAASNFGLTWNNYTDTSVTPNVTYTEIDEKAGGKYKGQTFGNKTTLKVRGNFTDAGSGLKQVFYKIYDRTESKIIDNNGEEKYNLTEAEKTALVEDVVSANQYFAPYSSPEYKRVFYNVPKNAYDLATDADKAKLDLGGKQLLKNSGDAVTETKDGVEYYKFWKIEEATYSFTIPQLNEGSNYLVIVAEDNVGNYYLDNSGFIDHDGDGDGTGSTPKREYCNFSMNVDTTAPKIELVGTTDIQYSNGGDFNVSVKVTDPEVGGIANSSSGIASVVLTTDKGSVPCKEVANNIWTGNVKDILEDGKTYTITASATDVAGTSSKMVVANVMVDSHAPTVVLTPPKDADDETSDIRDVNGIISISGTAEDDSQGCGLSPDADMLVLYYTKSPTLGAKNGTNATSETKISDDDIASEDTHTADDYFIQIKARTNAASWTIENVDVEKPDGTTTLDDSTEYFFMAATTDRAGNTGYSDPVKVKINKNSDRPIVRMSNIYKPTQTKDFENNTIYVPTGYLTSPSVSGSVKDDDGTILNLWIWQTKKNGGKAPTASPAKDSNGNITLPTPDENESGWVLIGSEDSGTTIEDGNWQIESSEGDGTTGWYWAVQDAKGTIFSSLEAPTDQATNELKRPYVHFKGATRKEDWTHKVIALQYDLKSPEIKKVELVRFATDLYKNATATPKVRYAAEEIVSEYMEKQSPAIKWSSEDKLVFGRDKALMYVKVTVFEETGMSATTPVREENNYLAQFLDVSSGEISVTHNAATNTYEYILGPYDLSKVALLTEEYKLNFIATDMAAKTGTKDKSIRVDNTAVITLKGVSPKPTDVKTGEFTFSSEIEDSMSTISAMSYHIPPYSSWNGKTDAQKTSYMEGLTGEGDWTEIPDVSTSWRIDFLNFATDQLGYTINKTNNTSALNSKYEAYNIEINGEKQGIYNIPVCFKVTDEVGNIGHVWQGKYDKGVDAELKDIIIQFNPNSDRPTVTITDPEVTTDGVLKSGSVTIKGTATDNEGIAAVYIQIEKNGDGTFAEANLIGNIETIPETGDSYKGLLVSGTKNWKYPLNISGLDTNDLLRIRAIAIDSDTEAPLVSAWSTPTLVKVNNTIPFFENLYVRQYASTDTNATGTPILEREHEGDIYITGSNWYLEGEVSTPTSGNKMTELDFKVDNETDEWTGNGTTATHKTVKIEKASVSYDGQTKFKFKIPVTSDTWSVEIRAKDNTDGNGGEQTETFTVNVDNTKPSFPDMYKINSSDEEDLGIQLYRDEYGKTAKLLGTGVDSQVLQNSNGSKFILAGKVTEAGSGFDKAVFYFKRIAKGNGSVDRVYNVMEAHGRNNTDNRTDIAASSSAFTTEKPIYINGDDLPVRALTLTKVSNSKFTNEEIEDNLNIRIGGLVKLGNLYRKITDIKRETGEITITPEYSGAELAAEFVYGMVVDHEGEREDSDGTVNKSSDDGDGIYETIDGNTKSGFNWTATFNSANLPDGPFEIHVVVFDKAGLTGHGYTQTKASNNAPRITKVMLGTDMNGNGRFDYGTGEFKTFYAVKDDDNNPIVKSGVANWELDTSTEYKDDREGNPVYWKVKSGIAAIPEFVGGTGPFYWQMSRAETKITNPGKIASNLVASRQLKASGANDKIVRKTTGGLQNATWSYSSYKVSGEDVENSGGSLAIAANDTLMTNGAAALEDKVVYYSFTFWDSTEDCTPGDDTGYTILNAKVKQDITDTTDPVAVIKPFEWTGTGYTKRTIITENEVEKSDVTDNEDTLENGEKPGTSETTVVVTDDQGKTTITTTKVIITPKNSLYNASKENGHIELEADVANNTVITGIEVGNKTLGADAKVSGKITFHGTAYDETRLSSLWFKFDGFSPASGLTQTTTDEGDTLYDASTNAVSGYTQAAWYYKDTATWIPSSSTIASGWEIVVSDSKFDQTGHYVDWYLSIDTAKIESHVGLDKALSVIFMDAQGQTSSTDASGSSIASDYTEKYNKPVYSMDVVPYISGITTEIHNKSGLKDSNIRSAKGYYSVIFGRESTTTNRTRDTLENDFIAVHGFNLNPAAVRIVKSAIYDTSSDAYNASGIDEETGDSVTFTNTPVNTEFNGSNNTQATGYTTFWAKNDIENSGYLEVFVKDASNNFIRTLNNINNNDSHGSASYSGTSVIRYKNAYNREAEYEGTRNVTLTDDRYILMWDMQKTNTKNGYYPNMLMEDDDPVFGLVDLNGWTQSTPSAGTGYANNLMPQMKKFNHENGEYSSGNYLIGGIAFDQMAMARDSAGKYIYASVYNFITGSMGIVYDAFASQYSDRWGWQKPGNQYNLQVTEDSCDGSNNALTIEGMLVGNLLMDRYKNLKLIADGNSTTTTGANIYMTYYDDYDSSILFREFKIKQKSNTDSMFSVQNIRFTYSNGYGFRYNNSWNETNYDGQWVKIGDDYYQLNKESYYSNYYGYRYYYTISGYSGNSEFYSDIYTQNPADNGVWLEMYDSNTITNQPETTSNSESAPGRSTVTTSGSRFYDFGIVRSNNQSKAVLIYYDFAAGKLKVKYSAQALNGSPTQALTWTESSINLPESVGQYVSMIVDGNALHIAAFDQNNSDLKYIYVPSYSGTDYTSMTIDAAGSVGNWTSINIDKTADHKYYNKPIIAYYNSSETGGHDAIKLAIPNAQAGSVTAGIDSSNYTSTGWEYMTVPSVDPAQGDNNKFQRVCLDFDQDGDPVVGYLATNIEFGKQLPEAD